MYPIPITRENFQKAWNYSCRKYRQAKKRTVIRKLTIPVSQILFFLCFLILTYGIAYDGFPRLVRNFLTKIPYTASLWQQFSEILLDSAGSLNQQLLHMGLFLYGIPLAAAVLLWLLAVLLYHPRKPTLSRDPELHPRDLQTVIQQAWEYRTPRHTGFLPFLSVLFAFLLAGGCAAFLLYFKNDPTVYNWLRAGMAQASLYFVLGCFLAFFSYLLLNLPLRLAVSLLYNCRIPTEFLDETERYRQTELRNRYKKTAEPEQDVPSESIPEPEDGI